MQSERACANGAPKKICQTLILPYLITELLVKNKELLAISLLARDINENCHSYLQKYVGDIFKSVCDICVECESESSERDEAFKHGSKIIIDLTSSECTHLLLTMISEYINSSLLCRFFRRSSNIPRMTFRRTSLN